MKYTIISENSSMTDKIKEVIKELQLNENPAAMAAASMASIKIKNPKTGKENSAVTALRDKDHPNHKKAKGIFSRLKDKFSKKKKDTPKKQSKADGDFYAKQMGFKRESIESKLRNMIRKELQSINEATGKEKVFMQNGFLWISWSTGSGSTTRMRGRGFVTDKKGDKNFDSDATQFAQWAKKNKPIKKQKQHNGSIMYLFKIPEYIRGIDSRDLSVWGGEVKPNKWVYLMVSSGKINVITVFHSKAEAMSWFNTTSSADDK